MYNLIKQTTVPLLLVFLLVVVVIIYFVGLNVSDTHSVSSDIYSTELSDFEKAEYYFSPKNYNLSLARYYYEASI